MALPLADPKLTGDPTATGGQRSVGGRGRLGASSWTLSTAMGTCWAARVPGPDRKQRGRAVPSARRLCCTDAEFVRLPSCNGQGEQGGAV